MIQSEIPNSPHDHPALSMFLLSFGFVMNIFLSFSGEDLYTWSFRGLSLLSLFMVIVINRRKFLIEVKEITKKSNG